VVSGATWGCILYFAGRWRGGYRPTSRRRGSDSRRRLARFLRNTGSCRTGHRTALRITSQRPSPRYAFRGEAGFRRHGRRGIGLPNLLDTCRRAFRDLHQPERRDHTSFGAPDRSRYFGGQGRFGSFRHGAAILAGRLSTGWLLDRFFAPRVGACLFALSALGTFQLATAHTLAVGIEAAALIGFGMGGEGDVTPYLLSRCFSLKSFSTLYGFTWTAYAIAGALGPVIMGRAFDATGSYRSVAGATRGLDAGGRGAAATAAALQDNFRHRRRIGDKGRRTHTMAHIQLEDLPGIRGLMVFRPETAEPLNQLADVLLRGPSTLSPGERKPIATFVSSRNDCFFCQSVHGAVAAYHLGNNEQLVLDVKLDPEHAAVSDKMKALLAIAGKVQRGGKEVTGEDIARARECGAGDMEIHDAVLIPAAFLHVQSVCRWT
jgi:uncharacterized peroxidase-related enzyme